MRRTILSSILVMLAGFAHAQTPECDRLCSRDFMFSLDSGLDVMPLVADGEHANGHMEDGRTPLIWAALDPDDEDAIVFTSTLLFAGGDVFAQDSKRGMTPLHWHLFRVGGPMKEVVAMYLGEGASVISKDNFGYSVLDIVNGVATAELYEVYELPYVNDEVADMIRGWAELEERWKDAFGMHLGRDPTSVRYFEVLAEEGYIPAMYAYASVLEKPKVEGFTPDIEQALYWYEEAASVGEVNSIFHVGSSAYSGTDTIEQNDAMAHEWLSLGARHGDTNSQSLLGLMYANGKGVERDIQKGLMWMIISLRFGEDTPDRVRLIDEMSSALSYQEVKEAEQMAKDCIINFFEHC
ncbi:SEL1-like repeat protein [Ruegeria arenilitoris]|uniref:SEL1-like repeat protein n=1 Tax=Ruegeria arenilitoris TaxID=1173585 RepID=UPI0014808E4F|nr:SEL1-like repeat protein [Ruegeria arenilitoris]